jgi:hypothetical protein
MYVYVVAAPLSRPMPWTCQHIFTVNFLDNICDLNARDLVTLPDLSPSLPICGGLPCVVVVTGRGQKRGNAHTKKIFMQNFVRGTQKESLLPRRGVDVYEGWHVIRPNDTTLLTI